jgi:C4-dicarboxylate-specific signal transduction histidine kinase
MLAARNIRMQVDSERQGIFRTAMMREHYHCLLHILTANSLDWLMQVEERRIRISISGDDDNCNLIYSDTGPGVPWQFMRRVFEPNFTTREGGRGMGLAIAERLVTLSGGDISLIVDGRRRGANFQVSLPRKRSRATF